MELDHVCVFVAKDGPELAQLEAAGFRQTYRRVHPGQGTANVCYAFDNLYLELLWLRDAQEAQSSAIQPARLYERATGDGCPFGIAWRGASGIRCFDYCPPYLPPGAAIQVAQDANDLTQPMMFSFPGTVAPEDWPAERRNGLQPAFGAVTRVELLMPEAVAPSLALRALQNDTALQILTGNEYRCRLYFERDARVLDLPGCRLSRD